MRWLFVFGRCFLFTSFTPTYLAIPPWITLTWSSGDLACVALLSQSTSLSSFGIVKPYAAHDAD